MELSPAIVKKLDILKSVSGSKNRNNVLEDLIRVVYATIRIRATDSDESKSTITLLNILESTLWHYWKPFKQEMHPG